MHVNSAGSAASQPPQHHQHQQQNQQHALAAADDLPLTLPPSMLLTRLAGRRHCCVAITRHMNRQQQLPRHIATAAGGSGPAAPQVQQMSVTELQELLANPILCEEVQFVDVREEGEHRIARLPHFKLLPLSQAGSWAGNIEQQLDPAAETVVLCHHGVRSMQAAMFFVSKGFSNVKNVTGGIAAYSMIDASVPEY